MRNKRYLAATLFLLSICTSCQQFSQSIKDTWQSPTTASPLAEEEVVGDQPDSLVYESRSEDPKSVSTLPSSPPIQKPSVASDIELLKEAEEKLRALPEFEGKDIVFYQSTHFYSKGRIRTTIQDASNPEYLDEYEYDNGTWKKGKPVVVSRSLNINRYLISLDKVPFEAAHRVYTALQQKLSEIGSTDADDPTVYFSAINGKLRWFPQSISSDRFRYRIQFDIDGQLISFKRE